METKICRICGEEKTLDGFNLHHLKGCYRYASDKLRSECKVCQALKAKEYRQNNREKLKEQYQSRKDKQRAWRERYYSDPDNAQKRRDYAKRYYYKHGGAELGLNTRLGRKYGITRKDYDEMLLKQGGGCAICGAKAAYRGAKHLAVDHDHGSGEVRGLLCNRCNRILGSLGDDPALLRKAADYLTGTKM